MAVRIALTIVALILFAGCGKKAETSTPLAQPVIQQTSAPAPADGNQTPASPTNQANANPAPDFHELNRALRAWVLSNRRRPANFEEFAATANVQIPPPPPGQKYVIGQHLHIMLVNK